VRQSRTPDPDPNQEDQRTADDHLKGGAQKRRVHVPVSNPPDEYELATTKTAKAWQFENTESNRTMFRIDTRVRLLGTNGQRQDFRFGEIFEILGHRVPSDLTSLGC
jgi:hypothetical protein